MKSTTLKGQLKEGAKEILKDQLPSFAPLVIRLIFTYKDINFSDNSAVSPSTFQHNGRTYKCGCNSWRDRDLSIGVAASFLQVKGIGSVSGEVADATIDNYASKDLQQAYSILSKLNSLLSTSVASGSIWISHSSKFATFKREIDDVDEDTLNKVVDAANLRDLIDSLPDGLDTVVGEHGGKLSGGQRQRVSIARALMRNPEVIVLDEATSALDSISEKLIQEALNNLTKDRTTFIVAHRLSTIKGADRIAVIADGHCVEYGTYDELMELKGEFYQMKSIQS